MDTRAQTGRLRTLGFGSLVSLGLLACLPPASLEPSPSAPAESAPTPSEPSGACRVLLGERDSEGGFHTRELRWDAARVVETERPGLVVGDEDEQFELRLERDPYDAAELYGDAAVVCEADSLMLRKLPDGVAQPLIRARPACRGTVDGETVQLDSTLDVVSALGPYVAWREMVEGRAPERTSVLDFRTIDVRNAAELDANVWLLEPSMAMLRSATSISCEGSATPQTTAAVDGFAIRWANLGGPRLLLGYPCCRGRSCELDDPLPPVDLELELRLPDPDHLIHSPYACGSLGLDGQLRTRDGVAVGRVELDASRLVSVLFLPPT